MFDVMSSFSCPILHLKYVNVSTCSIIVLSITVLLLIGTYLLNVITLKFQWIYFHSKLFCSFVYRLVLSVNRLLSLIQVT